MGPLTIGRVARQAGVGIETIRFYERRGLIEQPPRPNGSGFRVYPAETVKRIRFIRRAQQIGFALSEIGELLSLRVDPAADCSNVRGRALAKLQEVRRKIEHLQQIGAALEELIGACPGRGGLRACSILNTLVEVSDRAAVRAVPGNYTSSQLPPRSPGGVRARPSPKWKRRSVS